MTASPEQRALKAKTLEGASPDVFSDISNSSTEGLHASNAPVQKSLEKLGVTLQQVRTFLKASTTREPVKPGAKKNHDSRSSSPSHDKPLFIPCSSRNGSAPSTPDLTSPKCSTELSGLAPQDKLIHKQSGDPEILNSRHLKPPPRSPRRSLDEILTRPDRALHRKRLTSRLRSHGIIKPAPRQVPPPLRPWHSTLGDTSARSLPDKNTLDLEMELQQDSLTKEAHQQQQLPKKEQVLPRKKMAENDVKKSHLEGVCQEPNGTTNKELQQLHCQPDGAQRMCQEIEKAEDKLELQKLQHELDEREKDSNEKERKLNNRIMQLQQSLDEAKHAIERKKLSEGSIWNKLHDQIGESKKVEAKMKEEQHQLCQELGAKKQALKEKEETEVVRKKELHEQQKIRADLEAKLKEADQALKNKAQTEADVMYLGGQLKQLERTLEQHSQGLQDYQKIRTDLEAKLKEAGQALESKAQMEADLRGQLVQRERTIQHHSQGLQDYQQKEKEWAAKESDLLQELSSFRVVCADVKCLMEKMV